MIGRGQPSVRLLPRAGVYGFTPLKRHLRRRCGETAGSGFGFGGCCVGSSAGLMAMLVVLGAMSVGWMVVIAVLVTAQKLLPPGPPSMCRSHS
jgi:predicted metal-binding membrane protein